MAINTFSLSPILLLIVVFCSVRIYDKPGGGSNLTPTPPSLTWFDASFRVISTYIKSKRRRIASTFFIFRQMFFFFFSYCHKDAIHKRRHCNNKKKKKKEKKRKKKTREKKRKLSSGGWSDSGDLMENGFLRHGMRVLFLPEAIHLFLISFYLLWRRYWPTLLW